MSDPVEKSLFQLLREAIKNHLVANGGWDEGAIITDEQTDAWNTVAVAIGGAKNHCVVFIDIVEGDSTESEGLEDDLTIAVSTMAKNLVPGAVPEELLWQKLRQKLHGFVPVYEGGRGHYTERLRYQYYRKAPELIPEARRPAVQFFRQTVFKARFESELNANATL